MRAELQFPQLSDASPDPVLITNTKGQIYYVNPAWEKLTEYTFDEVKGKSPRLLQSGKTPRKIYRTLWKRLLKGQTFSTDEIINKKKTGQEFQVHATYYPVKNGNKIRFYVQMFHDITHRKTIEKQKDAFIGIASHELKTPITTLSAYSQILEKRLDEKISEHDKYFLKNIKKQTDRLNGLINDLLNVSRLESGKLEFHFREFDLNALVQRVVVDFQYTTDTHVITKIGSIQRNVLGDENRIDEVLVNLLTNAVKYSPVADKIMIKLSNDKKFATVTVQDFGYGISKKDLPHIFERFYRTKDKDEGKVAGFGLGLYICAQIIKRHKGKIWVESRKGKGSRFSFSLPLVNSD
ncbi:MAG TPA: PAS domain-containing sensor histidine kinase [Candidatus Acidoferrales bacterium]|nr:PAS domain-containing sensor histidine kinase [Candidatus Acidoferrales bacterium]